VLEAGGESVAVHLRPRSVPPLRCLELASELVPRADATGGWIVVNGRTDIARVAGAHAVQLGRGSLPIEAARRVLDDTCAIGVSVHAPEESSEASSRGADYLLLGTIFPTPSHPGMPVGGPELIAACASTGTPVIGIGGLDLESIGAVSSAGAHGVAVIRAVWQSDDPAAAVYRLVRILEGQVGTGDRPDDGEARA
jgi:thiamine-phosphate pyrophosphorylase